MTLGQKIARIFCVCLTLLFACILGAMTLASIVFVGERASMKSVSVPEILTGLGIVAAGLVVNAVCVFVLLQVRKFDLKLIFPKKTAATI